MPLGRSGISVVQRSPPSFCMVFSQRRIDRRQRVFPLAFIDEIQALPTGEVTSIDDGHTVAALRTTEPLPDTAEMAVRIVEIQGFMNRSPRSSCIGTNKSG